ncbi:MAG: hypothetical protein A2Z16_04350 [Chloroflexi bacterium RBG_16_54_18]|nr:MAG: hypothetical protein A2Z16_04350 [Chloroflexi bacterium RBG_16_54_18]
MSSLIEEKLRQHKQGQPVGIPSICSAHPQVLEAAARQSARNGALLLIESTCNQVNQYGGYMGLTPVQFSAFAEQVARRHQLPPDQLVLGGDHLGPYPWRHFPADKAMEKACKLVESYVMAGYTKIHLDTSMSCADDLPGQPLPGEIAAQRTAELCRAAENAANRLKGQAPNLVYVIGTEVPTPGGVQAAHESMLVTQLDTAEFTIETTRQAFLGRGLGGAWERVAAVVVQPGIEFADREVFPYDRKRAAHLSSFIEGYDRLVFEAHSTDYQTGESLKQLVEDHFAILKVGPALTFAYREAVFALSIIEAEFLKGRAGVRLSNLPEILEEVMLANPKSWEPYYQRDGVELRVARKYSYSDRARYYWTEPSLQQSLSQLFENLEYYPIPETLISQYLPAQYSRLRSGSLQLSPMELVIDHICDAILPYIQACAGD